MNINEEVIQKFYTAFSKLDYATMQSCYDENAIFNDPVFGILQGDEVKAMWEMLLKSAKNYSLTFNSVQADDEYGTCNWIANYTFSKTGNHVINNVKAHLRFNDGKILEHTDEFDFYKWSRQALGLTGTLLGWSGYIKNKVRYESLTKLRSFMEK